MNRRNPIVEYAEIAALGLPPSRALLETAAACAEAMSHLARQMEAEFWTGEHFGVTNSGERWVSEELYALVGESADRSHLDKKEIQVTRDGKTFTTTVYVRRPGAPTGEPKPTGAASEPKDAPPAKYSGDVKVSTFAPRLSERLPGHLHELFGKGGSPSHAADAAGAGPGDTVKIQQAGTHDDGSRYVYLNVNSPDGRKATRTLHVDPKTGRKWVENILQEAPAEAQGKGTGTAAFARQVDGAAAHGFSEIRATAGSSDLNGYYTLARWGYDGPVPAGVRAKLPPELASAKTVQDVMAAPGGREWWKKNGESTELRFDLAAGSRSRKALAAYVAARAAKASAGVLTTFTAEFLSLSVPSGAVDRRNAIVRNVRIVGPRSKNRRKYPAAVLERYAKLYDGVAANTGHHYDPKTFMPIEVPPQDKFGRIVNPRMNRGGLHADLKYNPEHTFARPFLWACEHDPSQYAFSALHRIKWKPGTDGDGDQVAEAVLEVASVDIVSTGGTASTIFESFTRESTVFPTDPTKLAAQFTSAGMLAGFLVDLLGAVSFSADELAPVLKALANFQPAADGAGEPISSGSGVDAAAAAMAARDMGETAEAFVRRVVENCPFKPETRPVWNPAQSVAELAAGWKG